MFRELRACVHVAALSIRNEVSYPFRNGVTLNLPIPGIALKCFFRGSVVSFRMKLQSRRTDRQTQARLSNRLRSSVCISLLPSAMRSISTRSSVTR